MAVYVLSPALWLLYALFPLGLWRSFRSAELDPDALAGDTHNIHVDDVVRLKGYELEPYICPKITEKIYLAARRAKEGVDREARLIYGVHK